jgi:hypothetical protein
MFKIDAEGNFEHVQNRSLSEGSSSVSMHDGKHVIEIFQDGQDIDVVPGWKSKPGKNYVVRLTKNIQFSDREYHVSFWSGFDFHVHNM